MSSRIVAVAVVFLLFAALGIANAQASFGLEPQSTGDRDRIERLMTEMAVLSLPVRVERALMLTLQAADAAVHQGRIPAARVLLRTFAYEVRGVRRAGRLAADTADVLIAKAERAAGGL